MQTAQSIFKVLFLLSLLSSSLNLIDSRSGTDLILGQVGKFPPSCNRIECPSYEVIHVGNGYEIRRYDAAVLTSTEPIQDTSLVKATRTGFRRLFDYIQGKNDYHQKIEMTAPVMTQVSPSKSAFTVSFFLPKHNQHDPAPAKNLHVQRWDPRYVAVKQFGGFVSDQNVGGKVAELELSLKGTAWAKAIDKSRETGGVGLTSAYTVAQYNSPFEFLGRVNEIWLPFQMNNEEAVAIVCQ